MSGGGDGSSDAGGLGSNVSPLRPGRDGPVTPAAKELASAAATGSNLTDLIVITGYSGAGKSTAMQVFEDAGYFCVDNLPPEMIRALAELFRHEGSKVERAAVVCDVRGGDFFSGLEQVVDDLAAADVGERVLFLEADEQTLLNRYKETRRRHPLAPSGSVTAGIAAERAALKGVRERSDFIVDTTGLTGLMLRRKIVSELLPPQSVGRLAVTFASFGFKHGPPRDADLAFDVRFLPNPHYEPELRPLTGLQPPVVEFIDRDGALSEFYDHLLPLLEYLLPHYDEEGKAHLNVAIGCTGGRHRSVAIAEHLAETFTRRGGYNVEVTHRDIDRGPR